MNVKLKSHLTALLVTLVVAAVGFYFVLPAISIHNQQLLYHIVFLCIIYTAVFAFCYRKNFTVGILNSKGKLNLKEILSTVKGTVIVAIIALAIWLIGSLVGMVIFNASRYQKLLTVEQGDFQTDVETISYDQIPRLDSASAIKLGDKKLGELSDLVSQFSVDDRYYTQINYQGKPVRVTPLQYVDVFKWMGNTKNGLPGYIMIDMVTQDVSVIRFSDIGVGNMKYATTEHFGKNLYRHLRFKYPTYIFEEPNFEIDENGVPYWVCARKSFKIGLYGGVDISGVVLVNAITGESQYYDVADVPTWVDRVYNASLIIEQFDYHGTLRHGFLNSVFGQKDCQITTDGYNYIAMKDDVFMYTGITSVASDQSNIGFILTNQRTKETKFYEIAGAEEYSAMSSAQGQVQNLRYVSTFPLLLNVGNEPTYFMALKDASELVKMYAMVNVAQYQLVATGQTLKECEANYIALITESGLVETPEIQYKEHTGAITSIKSAVINGNTHYYIMIDGLDKVFLINVSENNKAPLYETGLTVTVKYEETENVLVYNAMIS